MGIKKVSLSDGKSIDNRVAIDRDLSAECPVVHEYLTSSVFEDGTARRTSTITFFAEDGTFKGCLNERESGATLWAAGDGITQVLEALEALLEQERVPWRAARDKAKSAGKK